MTATPPTGLQETIEQFEGGCKKGGSKEGITPEVREKMIAKLSKTYGENESAWPYTKSSLLLAVSLGGRIAAAHANGSVVDWTAAKVGLKAVQEECVTREPPTRGRHCRGVNFDD